MVHENMTIEHPSEKAEPHNLMPYHLKTQNLNFIVPKSINFFF